MYQLRGVRYKNILDIESLSIPANKITCIIGESGSGKTTLLRLLNKLISCDQGEILYDGASLNTLDSIELRRRVVMLAQIPAIFSGTIRDNLLIGLKFSQKPLADDGKLSAILKMVNLNKSLDEDGEKLSGGEKQRLALGRVLLMDPEVFLLDEPSSSLDEDTEQLIIEKLVNHTKETNKTLIMVTHSRKIAQTFSEHIIRIKQGKILEPEERQV